MAPSPRVPITLDELLTQFRGLLDAHRAATAPARAGEGNLRCEGCLDCNRCRFCTQCFRCDDCSNCESCHECRGCTRCRSCRSCARSGNLEFCEGCEDSQYLVLCLDCSGCTQCFACVGLKGEEFCVLNQRYTRKDYFPVVQALKKRLEELIAAGHVLPELAAAGRGLWPTRGAPVETPASEVPSDVTSAAPAEVQSTSEAPGEVPTESAAPAEVRSTSEVPSAESGPTSAGEAPVAAPEPPEPEVEPWAEGIAPIRGDGDTERSRGASVTWMPQPQRPAS